MAYYGQGKTIEQLEEKTTLNPSDNFIVGGSYANKITWANMCSEIINDANITLSSSASVKTGMKWIDGKDIYVRVFKNPSMDSSSYNFQHGLGSISDVVAIKCTVYKSSVYGRVDASSGVDVQSSTIYLTGDARTYVTNSRIIILYTKS